MGFSSLGQAVPQLANLTSHAPGATLATQYGGQNFTHCCLVAMNQSLNVNGPNQSLAFNNPAYFLPSLTIAELEDAMSPRTGLFPCGASWNGNSAGAPIVRVPYNWCLTHCGGWEISTFDVLSQWVGPLVQFILPSLAFCLNVPRVSKIAIPSGVFQGHPRSLQGFFTYWIRLLWAICLMLVDTFGWLSMCFAFAGPMLLSAVYEYMLDRKVLEFLDPPKNKQKKNHRPTISPRLRAQLLLAVVVGNLRLSTGRTNTFAMTATPPSEDDPEGDRRGASPARTPADGLTDNTWSRVMSMLDEEPGPANSQRVSLGTKLKAILVRASSFGTTIGGPILFFGGGFIYTCLDIHKNSLGDNDTAHALAFGMWYMTVPNLAIIASAMLAATNPDALQGLVWDGGEPASRRKQGQGHAYNVRSQILNLPVIRWFAKRLHGIEFMEKAYDGHFETVSLWNRGSNKRRWINEAIRDYTSTYGHVGSDSGTPHDDMIGDGGGGGGSNDKETGVALAKPMTSPDQVREALREDWSDVVNALLASAIILITPTALAFITSYNMPRKGMACRSLTYLIYGISQVVESLLWMWELWLKLRYGERWSQAHTRAKTINWLGQMLVGFWAIFAAIVGTLMQLLGVYRSCACKIPISYWIAPNAPDAYIDLSSDSRGAIEAANQYWITTGAVSIGFLCMVSALAWWHQRRLRKMFRDEAASLDRDLSRLSSD